MKERLISGLSSVGTGSVESLNLVATALQSVTGAYSELTRASQQASIDLTNQLVDRIYERTIDSPQEELIEVAVNILSSIENTFEVGRHLCW